MMLQDAIACDERGALDAPDAELAAIERSRAGVYRLLARLWSGEVDEDLWRSLGSVAFGEETGSPKFDEACGAFERFLRDHNSEAEGPSAGHGGLKPGDPSYHSPAFARDERPDVLRMLAADYAVLCRGVDRQRGADPYESVHRNGLGLMMQNEWEEVLRFYRMAGLRRAEDAVEPEDHLGYELECMALLVERACNALAEHDRASYEQSTAFQRQLLEEHLLVWVPSFEKKVLEFAATDFYRAVARMTAAYLAMDAAYLDEVLGS